MRNLFRRTVPATPDEDKAVVVFCESVHATPTSPRHLRLTTIGGMKESGGIPEDEKTLCGRELHRGWDIRVADAEWIERSLKKFESDGWRPGHTCPTCGPLAIEAIKAL
jgi:hypothetical protein